MIDHILKLFRDAASIALPFRCPGCGVKVERLEFCAECARRIAPLEAPICMKCGSPMPAGVSDNRESCTRCDGAHFRFDTCRSGYSYDGPLRQAILRFKFRKVMLLSALLSQMMLDYESAHGEFFECARGADMLVPVPLHWLRYVNRGYNQTQLICAKLSREMHIPVAPALKRAKNNKPQSGLKLRERIENVKGVFAHNRRITVAGKKVLLIDDVMTTGSTVNECARVLKKCGAAEVHVFTLARRVMM